MQKYISQQLKTARHNKKLTQEQVAEAVGLSAKHYGCIERGEVSTTIAVLVRLQQVLEFEVSIIIKI
ncbi:helix-turn-helix transcriptional regulator [uncultured Phascolarctobacterium sp.]|uniref:helix-turn-helix domain-containing protein n=1 Tax=uncultured Phascolarctobacterium sp. TaxID=512296 RepID=UPI0026021BCE|nr:helix-turn-helix transcriptional regulator [uncultured Phascolarctobacterium sp.]